MDKKEQAFVRACDGYRHLVYSGFPETTCQKAWSKVLLRFNQLSLDTKLQLPLKHHGQTHI